MKNNNKKVRLYARVSTEEQARKNNSVPSQIKALKKHCKERNYQIMDIYIDNGISASSVTKRHELQRLMREVKPNEVILFTKLDRFSRNILDANVLIQDLSKKNVTIRAILENENDIDTTSADGKFLFDLQVSLAERERKVVSERIKFSFQNKIDLNQPLGKVPFGYKLENKVAVIDNQKAEIIIDIYNTFLSTRNISKTQRTINQKYGIAKGRSFYQKVLRNTGYYGYKYEKENFYPPIIDKYTFDSVQSFMSHSYTRTNKRKYLFNGLVVCECGCRMNATYTKKQGKEYFIYRCTSKSLGKGNCNNRISELKLEKMVLSDFEKALNETLVSLETQEETESIIDPKPILDKMTRLKNLYIDGIITKEEFSKKWQDFENQLPKDKPKKTKKEISELKSIKEHYQEMNREEKGIFWKSVINKIVISKDKEITIDLL